MYKGRSDTINETITTMGRQVENRYRDYGENCMAVLLSEYGLLAVPRYQKCGLFTTESANRDGGDLHISRAAISYAESATPFRFRDLQG